MPLIPVGTSVPCLPFQLPTGRFLLILENQSSFQERKLQQEHSSVIRPVGIGILIIYPLFKHRLPIVKSHQNKWHVCWRQGKKTKQKQIQKTQQNSFILFVQGFYALLLLGATKFPSATGREEKEKPKINNVVVSARYRGNVQRGKEKQMLAVPRGLTLHFPVPGCFSAGLLLFLLPTWTPVLESVTCRDHPLLSPVPWCSLCLTNPVI